MDIRKLKKPSGSHSESNLLVVESKVSLPHSFGSFKTMCIDLDFRIPLIATS